MKIMNDGVGIYVVKRDDLFSGALEKNTGIGVALLREILSITGITI